MEKLEILFWKKGKIIDSKGKDLTDKAKGIGGREEKMFGFTNKKKFEYYALNLLDNLKKTNKMYEDVNSYVILRRRKIVPPTITFGDFLAYEFQYSQI